MEDNLSEGRESLPKTNQEDLNKSDSLIKNKLSEGGSLKHSVLTGSHSTTKNEVLSSKTNLGSAKDVDSLKHSVTASHSTLKKDLSSIKDLDSAKDLDSLKHTVTGSHSTLKKELSSTKDMNSVKDRVSGSESDKRSTLLKKTSMISATSELSIKEPVLVKTSTEESSQSKSQIISVNTSFSNNNNNNLTEKISSEKSIIDNYTSVPSKIYSKETHLDHVSKISFNKLNLDDVHKEAKTPTLLKSDHMDVPHKTQESCLNYISPWAKSSTSCNPTLSQSSTKAGEIKDDFNIKCIPPWAKTLRRFYGMTCSDPSEDLPQQNLQEKIKSLMDKHSRLMLVKRGESRKQLILKPSECGNMGTVKMASKNTRYYMTPIPREVEEPFLGSDIVSTSSRKNTSEKLTQGSDVMAMTKKTSRSQAKNEVSNVLKSLYNSKINREIEKDSHKLNNQKIKCPKITPSKIREYVDVQTLNSDARQLHEIIKIKKVPSLGTQIGRKPSSKYIINVPKSSKGDGTTVNKITVKEKRKIRIDSVEDINENITEIIYNKHDSTTQEKVESRYTAEENVEHDVVPYSKRRKLPTKSRTLEVTAESTPIISDLLKKEERERDKILLIQFEKKSKPSKGKSEPEKPTLVSTQLLGIRQPCNETLKEMYLYGTETDGKTCKEKITQVYDVSPTLREKVNMIFQELREMTFKPCAELESISESRPSVSSKTFQHPSMLVETDAVSVQALPEVRSAEVQVHDSILFSRPQSIVSQAIPASLSEEENKESISEQKDKIGLPEITDGSSTEIRPKTRSQLDSKQSTDIEDVDDTILSELKEKDTFEESKHSKEESKHSKEGIEKQETINLEGTEAENLIDEKETDESDLKTIQDDQEDISQDEQKQDLENKISEEHLVEEKDEALEYEETLFKGERGSKDSVTKDDEHLKEEKDNDEIEGDKEEEKDDEYFVKKDTEEEDKEESQEMGDQQDRNIHVFAEDIRSYDFDPAQDYELRMISSSKFFHQRDSLMKLNWTEDILYLEKNTCPQLVKALAEIAVRQPEDPISYLAHWIYKDYQNRESDEQNSVFKEHLEVAKGMLNTKKDEKPAFKKFSIRRYPMKRLTVVSTASETSHIIEETETEELYDGN